METALFLCVCGGVFHGRLRSARFFQLSLGVFKSLDLIIFMDLDEKIQKILNVRIVDVKT